MASHSSYEFYEAKSGDLQEIADVHLKAFSEDPVMVGLMPGTPYEKQMDWWAKEFEGSFRSLPGVRFWCMKEKDSGKIGCFSRWHFPPTDEEKAEKPGPAEPDPPLPEGTNLEWATEMFGNMAADRKKWIDENTAFCYLMATLPEARHKGLATVLLKHGLAVADQRGWRSFIQGTAMGTPLYRKLGWKDVGSFLPVPNTAPELKDHAWISLMREPGKAE